MKLLEHGEPTEPLYTQTLPPLSLKGGRRERLIALSRQKYGRRRDLIEARLT